MKSAIVFGASGLVGRSLVHRLHNDTRYESIKIFCRTPLRLNVLKAEEIIVDFSSVSSFQNLLTSDEIFCCLGSTRKKAGSKEAFYKIDHDLVVNLAKTSAQNGVKKFVVISSMGANSKSSNFYLRTKGEMEHDLEKIGFNHLKILRPSFISGKRKEDRFVESMAVTIFSVLKHILPDVFKPISAHDVAKAMIQVANSNSQQVVFNSGELQKIIRHRGQPVK